MSDLAAVGALILSVLGATTYIGRKLQVVVDVQNDVREFQKDLRRALAVIDEHCIRLAVIETHLGLRGHIGE